MAQGQHVTWLIKQSEAVEAGLGHTISNLSAFIMKNLSKANKVVQ